jgi:hypothetical protein
MRMTAVITCVPGHNPAAYRAALDVAKRRLLEIEARVQAARGHILREHGPHALDAYDQGRQTAAGWTALSDLEPLDRDRRRLISEVKRLEADAAQPATADTIKLAVIDSYEQREMLKARRYRFERDAHWRDSVGRRVQAGWVWSGSAEDAVTEIEWLRALGAAVVVNGPLVAFSEAIRARLG